MLNTLPSVINSFSTNSKATVGSLIRDMKIDKAQLSNVVKRLSSYSSGAAFAAAQIGSFSILDKQILVELFKESFLRTKNLYAGMDGVGFALNSMVNVFTAEIDKVQQDIDNLELFINNYEFISGKDDLYNFNYIERFNDFLGDYRYDGASFLVPDRDKLAFPSGGNGFIDSGIGAFKFGSSVTALNVLGKIKSISINSNYDNYITSNSDPMNLFNDNFIDHWNITIKSPAILTSNLSAYSAYLPDDYATYNGAQTAMEVSFSEAIAMDTIRLAPNRGNDFHLMQIILFSSDEGVYTTFSEKNTNTVVALATPAILRGSKEITFSKMLVNKVIFIFNQSSYLKSLPTPISSELNSKAIMSFVNERIESRKKKFSKNQDIVYWFFNRKTTIAQAARSKTEYDFYTYRFPSEVDDFKNAVADQVFVNSNFGLDYRMETSSSPVLMNFIQGAFQSLVKGNKLIKTHTFSEGSGNVSQRLLDYAGYVYAGKSNDYFETKDQFYNYPIAGISMEEALKAMLVSESPDLYEYNFSLRSIEFLETTSDMVQKACFVSKKIPTNAQVLAIKAKVDTIEAAVDTTMNQYDLDALVSYELSISNIESPVRESDWYPVALNNQQAVDAEVLFFDITTLIAKLRFNAVPGTVLVFKDGKQLAATAYRYNSLSKEIELLDLSIFSPASVFCAQYDLDLSTYSPHEVDFAKENLLYDSVKTYGSALGSGQGFSRTDNNKTVTLEYTPYVNQSLASSTVYSNTLGTIFTKDTTGYSPVRVEMEDGSFATNLTNYTGAARSVQFYYTDRPLFIQSGKSIVFNNIITSPFTVHYDYIPDNLRFRFIARKNVNTLDAPIKVDNVLLKMKTLNYDPYYDKLHAGLGS